MRLSDLGLKFSGLSLFHEYAANPQVLNVFLNRYLQESLREGEDLNSKSLVPLQILTKDFKSKSAIDIALSQ